MSNADQAEYWTGQSNWVTYREAMDITLAPVLDLVMSRSYLQPGEAVLDIGCGTGASTERAADIVGMTGHVLGIDISPTLLAAAQDRLADTPQAATLLADAQTHTFDHLYDAVISRFGVMFFSDSEAAFANIVGAMRPGGRLVCAAWGPAPDNPFFMVPAKIAQARLGQPPKVDRTLPGPFAFEDRDRLRKILATTDLTDIQVVSVPLELTPPDGPEAAADLLSHIGPVNAVIRHFEGTEDDRAAIRDDLARALEQFDTSEGMRIPAVINLAVARLA